MSFLKRLLGSTDAVEDARARAGKEEGAGAAPAGWNVTSPQLVVRIPKSAFPGQSSA